MGQEKGVRYKKNPYRLRRGWGGVTSNVHAWFVQKQVFNSNIVQLSSVANYCKNLER